MRPFHEDVLNLVYFTTCDRNDVVLVPRVPMHTVPMNFIRKFIPREIYPHYTIVFRYGDMPYTSSNVRNLTVDPQQTVQDTLIEEIIFRRE